MRTQAAVRLIAIVTLLGSVGAWAIPDVGATPPQSPPPVELPAPEAPAPTEAPSPTDPAPADTVISAIAEGAATSGTVSIAEVAEPATATQTSMPVRGAATQIGPPLGVNLDTIPPANSGNGRRMIYSISQQRVWAVDDNEVVVKTHRVSGKTGEPQPGSYRVWSRSRYTFAANNPSIRWGYMVRFAYGDRGGNIGFHEIPMRCGQLGCAPVQSEAELGTPLSGGCVRQATLDAIWVWDWADIGTAVVVLP